MTVQASQRRLLGMAALAVAVLAVHWLIVQPYLAYRADLVDRRDAAAARLKEFRTVLDDEQRLQRQTASMQIAPDPAAAEAKLVHLLHDWEQHASLTGGSFQQQRAGPLPGMVRMTFAITASGTLPGVALLLHQAESATVPLRIDSVHLVSTREGTGEELQLNMAVSTLCQSPTATPGGNARWTGATALARGVDAAR